MENYLTSKDIITRLRISRSGFYSLISKYNFPRPVKIGGARRYPESRVNAWIEGCWGAK